MSSIDSPAQVGVLSPLRSMQVRVEGASQTYSSGVTAFTPVATPTDIAAITAQSYDRVVSVKRISISAIADAATSIEVLLQRSANGGGGTSAAQNTAKHDSGDNTATGSFIVYSANRSSGGNGVSSTRPIVRADRLRVGTAAAPSDPIVWDFATRGSKGLTLRTLVEWFVINLKGATMPAGLLMNIDVEWSEEQLQKVAMCGDSTTSNAITLFSFLGNQPRINSQRNVYNYGSNGFRLTDFLNNTNGVTYPLSNVITNMPDTFSPVEDKIVICYGINDVRTGATSQSQLIALLESTIASIKTSRPDIKIILWGPNSFTSDDPGSTGFVTSTGLFSGMTLAQAAQSATDILYNAYQSFSGDPRIYALVQKQDIFGRTCVTNAASGLMTDILHPNARGQKLSGKQILPYLLA